MSKKWWPKSLRLRSRVSPADIQRLLESAVELCDALTLAFLRNLAAKQLTARLEQSVRIVLHKLQRKEAIKDETDLLSDKEKKVWFDLVRDGVGISEREILWRLFCVEERRMSHKFFIELFSDAEFEICHLYPHELESFM